MIRLTAFEELVLQRLHLPEGLRPVEPLGREVRDELVELLGRRLRVLALILRLDLLEEVAHCVEVVGRDIHRIDRLRGDDHLVRPHLEQPDAHRRGTEEERSCRIARHTERDGPTRIDRADHADRVLDRDVHEWRTFTRREGDERQRARESIRERMEAIQCDRPCPLRERPQVRQGGAGERHERSRGEDDGGHALRRMPCLAQDEDDSRCDERGTKRRREDLERSPEADPTLGAPRGIGERANDLVVLSARGLAWHAGQERRCGRSGFRHRRMFLGCFGLGRFVHTHRVKALRVCSTWGRGLACARRGRVGQTDERLKRSEASREDVEDPRNRKRSKVLP